MVLLRSLDCELQKLIKIFPETMIYRNSKSSASAHLWAERRAQRKAGKYSLLYGMFLLLWCISA